MTFTKEELNLLHKIQNYCTGRKCRNCPFAEENTYCIIGRLPEEWCIELIEEKAKEARD